MRDLALMQYGDLAKKYGEVYAMRALREADTETRAKLEGAAEAFEFFGEALLEAATWDTSSPPIRRAGPEMLRQPIGRDR